MKKVLVITSVASMIDQFLFPSLELLQNLEYEVHVACNFERGSTCSDERVSELKNKLRDRNISYHQIDFARDVTKVSENIRAYKEVCRLVSENKYDLIHCHSPIAAFCTRLACRTLRKKGLKVIYTAHGFHFYKGAPLKNWLIYYPLEKYCSRLTDLLITINQEDYALARKKMKAKHIAYVPGVGIDLQKFSVPSVSSDEKRAELGIPDDVFLLLSVGELNRNKNHEVILRAMSLLNDPNIHYAIAGTGNLREYLLSLSEELGIRDHVHLLGYRGDVAELYRAADVFVFPSFREGLSVSLMEAMASGLPCLVSDIRGNRDLIDEIGGMRFDPSDIRSAAQGLRAMMSSDLALYGNHNAVKISDYSTGRINELMKKLYLKSLNL